MFPSEIGGGRYANSRMIKDHKKQSNRFSRNSVDQGSKVKTNFTPCSQPSKVKAVDDLLDSYPMFERANSRESQPEGKKSKSPFLAQNAFPKDFFTKKNRETPSQS